MVSNVAIPNPDGPYFDSSRLTNYLGLLWTLSICGLLNARFIRTDGLEAQGNSIGLWDLSRGVGSRPAEIRVGPFPIWVHVVDDYVWQIFQKKEGEVDKVSISSRRRHTRLVSDWSSDVCSSD